MSLLTAIFMFLSTWLLIISKLIYTSNKQLLQPESPLVTLTRYYTDKI